LVERVEMVVTSAKRFRALGRAIAVVLLLPCAARASRLLVEEPGIVGTELRARVRAEELLDPRTRGAVASGLPITVRFTADLWRERRRWFDQHVAARAETFRIRWDPRERVYTLSYPGPGRRVDAYQRLDDLLEDLSWHEIAVHPRGTLDERSRYFVALEVAVRPLTLEEFRDLEGWVGGRIRGGEEPPDAAEESGDGEGVPGAVLGFLLDLSGFGDVILTGRTPSFRPAELLPLQPLPERP
jgi:hypothetical protein